MDAPAFAVKVNGVGGRETGQIGCEKRPGPPRLSKPVDVSEGELPFNSSLSKRSTELVQPAWRSNPGFEGAADDQVPETGLLLMRCGHGYGNGPFACELGAWAPATWLA